jgi:hypothetical protein
VNQQVTAPTPEATSVENSRDLQGIRVRIRPSFVEVNGCHACAKRPETSQTCGRSLPGPAVKDLRLPQI